MSTQEPITIQVLNPVSSIVLGKQGYRLSPILSYDYEYYIQGQYRKMRRSRRIILIEKVSGRFPTGLLNRAVGYCKDMGIPLEVQYSDFNNGVTPELKTKLPLKLRDYQTEAVSAALFSKRGIIVAPTGSGKTFIMAAIASYFPNHNIAFVVHTKTLMMQTISELKRFFPDEIIGQIGEGIRDYTQRLSVAMIQTVHSDLKSSNKQVLLWSKQLKIVFVDECHHVSKFKGSYVNLLRTTMAPARFGVTATLPVDAEAKLALEAYIGQTIYEVKMNTLIDLGKLAVPKLKLFKVPEQPELKEIRKYNQVYQLGVTENRSRNRKILSEAGKLVQNGLTVLMIVTRIEHGQNLLYLASKMYPELSDQMTFIHGATDGESRELVRKALQEKNYKLVIASTIWKEGVDIPSIGAIINAAGGKSEIATIQTLGRGLRVAPGKEEIIFYDFFDNSHPYLISHFGERLCLYFDLGWL